MIKDPNKSGVWGERVCLAHSSKLEPITMRKPRQELDPADHLQSSRAREQMHACLLVLGLFYTNTVQDPNLEWCYLQ